LDVRVLVVAENLEPIGGLERLQFDISRGLVARGHQLDLAFLRYGSMLPAWRAISGTQVHVPAVRFVRTPGMRGAAHFFQAIARCRRLNFDVVYVHHYRQLQLGLVLARRRGVPLVWHCHNVAPIDLGPIGRRLVASADCVVQVSKSNAELWYRLGLPRRSTIVLRNGVDHRRFRPPNPAEFLAARRGFEIPAGAAVVTYLGGADEGKGWVVLLEAWAQLRPDPGSSALVFAGDVSDCVRDAVATSDERATIRLVGFLPQPDSALQCADVVVAPSTGHDPCPLAVLEGMACGRLVLASRVGGIPELLGAAFDDLLVTPSDPAALAAKLRHVLANGQLLRRVGAQLRERSTERFTLDRLVNDVEAVLIEQIGRHGRR
jgi:glycosyltransferase involved in cell wall biosynthesis